MSTTDVDHVDLHEVLRLLDVATQRAEDLDSASVPSESQASGRDRSRALANVTRELLFLGQVMDKSRVLVMDQYHKLRGYTEHLEQSDD